ncbi:MAG: 2-oxo-4-hydroxy-4-carboxy-5-ureidoimidazoline decarboxylase [Burkholderiaceae bacterium]|nr:2-oxo-4-hydroxy-4-carboxy-5-ureidoimidazoline decarboxylase [Microbacteriaceae bacterium]
MSEHLPGHPRDVTDAELRAALTAALAVHRFVDEVASQAPFASTDALLLAARTAATPLSPAEIDEAVAHHPRIGEAAEGEGAAQNFSRAEQSFAEADDADIRLQIERGNREYESRFGRVFLIRAAGRTRREILAELRRRIELSDAEELPIVGEQLRDIAHLRLAHLFGQDPA